MPYPKAYLRVALAALSLLLCSASWAVEHSLFDLFQGKAAPLTVTVKEMDGTWRRFVLGKKATNLLDGLATTVMSSTSLTASAFEYFTKGEMVTCKGETYVVAYQQPLPTASLANILYCSSDTVPNLLTNDTELTLCLLNMKALEVIQTIEPVDVNKLMLSNTKVFQWYSRKAKEATLRANLQRLRSAVSQFQADTGYYPKALTDLNAVSTAVMAVDATGTDLAGTNLAAIRASYKGPYLDTKGVIGIPQNPFTASADAATITKHWTYTNTNGTVVSGVLGTTSDGVDFANL